MTRIYDFIVIGAGISGCTFASNLNKRFPDASILLIEHGRRYGGRSTTRKSRRYSHLEFDHGLPSIRLSENVSKGILTLISPLIKSNKLLDISNEILLINEFSEMERAFVNERIYRSFPFMINFCEEIINQSPNPLKINFLFKTLIKSIKFKNYTWEVQIEKGRFIKSKALILSSSLIVHPRCLEILKINSIPLRNAINQGEDEIVDSVITQTRKQQYIKRRNYILYVSNFEIVKVLSCRYLQICFSNVIKYNFNFERIIFQMQSDGSMIIILHCSYINEFIDINIEKILQSLKLIFINHPKFLDLFSQAILIDTMDWRASQPINNLVPKELQWSSVSNIGFCGDWIDLYDGCGCVESAINSSIRLANLLSF
tara:strand:+ start:63 stop:1178 length:1116 start_codon:yes stop_codon:yes gene_type:complete